MNERDAYRARLAYMEQLHATATAIRDEHDEIMETRYHDAFTARVREREKTERAIQHGGNIDPGIGEIQLFVSHSFVVNEDENESSSAKLEAASNPSSREENTASTMNACCSHSSSVTISDEAVSHQAPVPVELIRDLPSISIIGIVEELCTRMTSFFFK